MNTRQETKGSFLYEGSVRPYYNNADDDGDFLELSTVSYGRPRDDDDQDVRIEIRQEARTEDVLRILSKLIGLVREGHAEWREDLHGFQQMILENPEYAIPLF